MLLHEALARSRMHQLEREACEHRLARHLTAGRWWDGLARFAARRASIARTSTAPATAEARPVTARLA